MFDIYCSDSQTVGPDPHVGREILCGGRQIFCFIIDSPVNTHASLPCVQQAREQ